MLVCLRCLTSRRCGLQARPPTQFVNSVSYVSWCLSTKEIYGRPATLDLIREVEVSSQPASVVWGRIHADLRSLFEDPLLEGIALGQGFMVLVWC